MKFIDLRFAIYRRSQERFQVHAPQGYWRIGWRRWSVLLPLRSMVTCAILFMILVVMMLTSLGSGTVQVAPLDAWNAVFGVGDPSTVLVVRTLRLGRVLAGMAAGAALGIAGCLLQTLSRNRLANPDTIGIDNAATAFAVASVVGVSTSLLPSAMALVGAITMLALAFALSGGDDTRGYRFLLTGLGLGAVCGAITNVMLARAPIDAANAAYPWTIGTLNNRSGLIVDLLLWSMFVLIPLAMLLGTSLNLARLPDAVMHTLGVRINRLRVATIGLAGLLTGLAVAVIGPVGMIGLAAPEAARRLAGPRSMPVLASGLAGASLTLLADLIGRTWWSPQEIPVGIIVALVGGPYLLWILMRTPRGAF